MRALALATAFLVLACAADARPAAETYAGTFRLHGTEPFWDAQIGPGRVTFHDDLQRISARNPGVVVRRGSGTWSVRQRRGVYVIVIARKPCDDGMNERIFPYEAKIYFGERAIEGCAYHPR